MGGAKRAMMEADERGFWPVDGHVCADCVDDEGIKRYIEENAVETRCDFCGVTSAEPIAAVADAVVDHIAESIKTEYALAVNELGWESAEGGYLGDHYDMADLLDFELDQPLGHSAFADAVKAAATDDHWTERDYYGTKEDEALLYDWDLFVATVKHGSRYMFLRLEEAPDNETWTVGHAVRRGNTLLGALAALMELNGLFRELPAGTQFYRTRISNTGSVYAAAKELGTPPATKAAANRMSGAGIAMFYGATDEETAIVETSEPGDALASVGTFLTEDPCWIADLDRIPDVPSLFDAANRGKRRPLRFLHRFREDIGKPIVRDGREHIDYVPTQIVTEYLRLVHRPPDGGRRPLSGLMFTSSKTGGQNVALFVTREACLELGEEPEIDGLQLRLKAAHVRGLAWPVQLGPPRPASPSRSASTGRASA